MGKYSMISSMLCIAVLINSFLPLLSFKLALAMGNETDRLALLAIKEDFLAEPTLSWNASVNFCEWEGVQCDLINTNRVISLKLGSMNLGGSISPSIGNLSFLRELNLSDNKLQGHIPREFGYLKELHLLHLSRNNLQGNIPIELANCSKLQTINLNYNNLTGKIPFELADSMNNLTALSLYGNNFTGDIPSSLGNVSSLAHIQLGNNHLEGIIPDTLGRLSMLKIFAINGNNISGNIPSSFYNLSSLTYVHMALNSLSGSLAPELGFAFPELEILYLGENQFSGSIPRSLTNISSLQQFDISSNGFSGLVPDSMGNLQNLDLLYMNYNHLGNGKAGDLDFLSSLSNCSLLKDLVVHKNRFGGVLPESIANLSTQVEFLYLGDNQISGSIPEGIGNLLMLKTIQVETNLLTGNVPSSIGKLKNLRRIDLSENGLSGEIPSSIGNLSQLFDISLRDNKLEGRIPVALGKCENMQRLDLSQNKLDGSIPHQLVAGFESLITFNLSYNSLTGVLPSNISYSNNLMALCVDNNNFIGEIPRILGDISSLRTLRMQGNNFQANIPVSFALLRALDELDLSNNNLSGIIPLELQNLPFLTSLNLSFNQLEGEVPREGVFENITQFSVIGNKQLCGGNPELELPECFNQETKKKASTKFILGMCLGIPLAAIIVALIAILCRRDHSRIREVIPVALLGDGYLRVSYKELLEATSGFATSNLIGCGSFGSVYKGILPKQEKPVAIKVLNLQNTRAMKSFMAECEALRKIRHRNLVKVVTSCSSIDYQGRDFKALVLELMANGSLDCWLHNDPYEPGHGHLNFRQILDIAIDVANALDYLHHHCKTIVVHCDLKPSNILLDEDMIAHVGDFGMAKLLSEAANNAANEQTTSSIISGTIGYVAPEYGMGFPASPERDVYSYGILLLEMITGKRPTDEAFNDGLNLHNLCKMALPQQLEQILHSALLQDIDGDGILRESLLSFTNIGIACSVEVPAERMKIEDAITDLHAIKANFSSNKLIH